MCLCAGRPPLVILAHSVGSYMAVHAVHRLEAWLHSVQQFFTHSPSQQSPQSHPQLSQPQLAGSNPQPNTQSQSQLQSPALSQSDTVAECVSSGQVGPRGGTVDLWHAAEPLSLDGHPLPAPAHTPPTLAPGHGHALPPVHKVRSGAAYTPCTYQQGMHAHALCSHEDNTIMSVRVCVCVCRRLWP